MKKNDPIVSSLDLGNEYIKLLTATRQYDESGICAFNNFEGVWTETKGLYNSRIKNKAAFTSCIETIVNEMKETNGIDIRKTNIIISHPSMRSVKITKAIKLTKPIILGEEMLEKAKARALERVEETHINDECLKIYITKILGDGKDITHEAENTIIKKKLELDFLCLLQSKKLKEDLEEVITPILDIESITPTPLANSSLLTDEQKEIGTIFLDIGASMTSMAVWKNGVPLDFSIFQFGGSKIAAELALNLQISIQDAGNLLKQDSLKSIGITKKDFSMVQRDIKNSLNPIKEKLMELDANKGFPGGVIISGGGSKLFGVKEIIQTSLKLFVEESDHIDISSDYNLPITFWHSAYSTILETCGENSNQNEEQFNISGLFKSLKRGF